jgi:ATP-dependent helicase/nuclease subunit A
MKTSAGITKRDLTTSQLQAAESIDKWTAVVAGAGSGKTTVLVDRCLKILSGDPRRLASLLAITFTEKAASELKKRIRQSFPPRDQHFLAEAWIGTFHAFCARIIRNNAPLLNLDPSFAILDENAFHLLSRRIIREKFVSLLDRRDPDAILMVEELDFKNCVSLLKNLMEFRFHARKAFEKENKRNDREAKLHASVRRCYCEIESTMLESLRLQNTLDFQELEIKAVELLKTNPQLRRAYQNKFRHILVDEYQDTSDIQSELVFLVAEPGKNCLAIVGDPRQSIYRFRGANVHCFFEAVEKIRRAGGEIIYLEENFRSEPAIVSFTNKVFGDLWETGAKGPVLSMTAARKDVKRNPAVNVLLIKTENKQLNSPDLRRRDACAIALRISELVEKKYFKFRDIACLFQAMTAVFEYEKAFKEAGIPYRFFGGRGLLDRQEIKDLMHALAYAADPKDNVAMLGLLRSPLIGLSDDDCARLAGPEGAGWKKAVSNDERLELLRFLAGSSSSMLPSEILKKTIAATGYDIVCQALDPSGGSLANIERFISLVQSLEREGPLPLPSFIDFAKELREKSAKLGDPPGLGFGGDAVSCMTIHAAKGLEFPAVIIPDLLRRRPLMNSPWCFQRKEGLAFKLKDDADSFAERVATEEFSRLHNQDSLEEENESKRLLYVAMTRARDLLILPLHEDSKKESRWHEWLKDKTGSASSFVTQLNIEACQDSRGLSARSGLRLPKRSHPAQIGPLYSNPLDPDTYNKVKFEADSKIFTVSELETYDRCPHEYYLKYVLGLPAEAVFGQEKTRLPANIRGSIVHAVLQKYDPAEKVSIDELIFSECHAALIVPDKKIVDEIKKPLHSFLANQISKEIGLGEREVRFDWKFSGVILTGTIDWLRPAGGAFEIVDFKTDMIKAKDVKARAAVYDTQLVAYALAAQACLNKPVVNTCLYFLEPDIMFREPFTNERGKKGAARLEKIIWGINNSEFRLGQKTRSCYTCPFKKNGICSL